MNNALHLVWSGFMAYQTLGYFMPNSFLYIQTVPFQTIQFSISIQFKCQNSSNSNNSV